jgi:lysophospholipase L1-like esterase
MRIIIALVFVLTSCTIEARTFIEQLLEEKTGDWVGTWMTAVQLTEPGNLPPAPGLARNTVRQVVHVSLGGETLRAGFSNVFGTSPIEITAATVAVSRGNGAIDPSTEIPLTFGGAPNVVIQPGDEVTSDSFSFPLQPLSDVAITIKFGSMSTTVITGHPGSRTTSYIMRGDAMADSVMANAIKTDHWYVISSLDVRRKDASAVVTLGNSITDGRGSGTNMQNRWPDELARRLQADNRTVDVAVLNAGIGGNCVLVQCLGPSALNRFERDVLTPPGVRWLIILEGVNDIGNSGPNAPIVAQNLIDAFEQMITDAHANDILVYGATIMPFGNSFYFSPGNEAARQTVNEWIRTSGAFDAVIDLDAAMRDPDIPNQLAPDVHDGDFLHPSQLGHRKMAEAVDLSLFAQ